MPVHISATPVLLVVPFAQVPMFVRLVLMVTYCCQYQNAYPKLKIAWCTSLIQESAVIVRPTTHFSIISAHTPQFPSLTNSMPAIKLNPFKTTPAKISPLWLKTVLSTTETIAQNVNLVWFLITLLALGLKSVLCAQSPAAQNVGPKICALNVIQDSSWTPPQNFSNVENASTAVRPASSEQNTAWPAKAGSTWPSPWNASVTKSSHFRSNLALHSLQLIQSSTQSARPSKPWCTHQLPTWLPSWKNNTSASQISRQASWVPPQTPWSKATSPCPTLKPFKQATQPSLTLSKFHPPWRALSSSQWPSPPSNFALLVKNMTLPQETVLALPYLTVWPTMPWPTIWPARPVLQDGP